MVAAGERVVALSAIGLVFECPPRLGLCQACEGGCIYLELDKGKINSAQLVIEPSGEMLHPCGFYHKASDGASSPPVHPAAVFPPIAT